MIKTLSKKETVNQGNGNYWWYDFDHPFREGGNRPFHNGDSWFVYKKTIYRIYFFRDQNMSGGSMDWMVEKAKDSYING